MWCHLFTKFACCKVPPVMVSTHGSVVPLAMFVILVVSVIILLFCDYSIMFLLVSVIIYLFIILLFVFVI